MYEHLGIDNKNQSYRCFIFFKYGAQLRKMKQTLCR